MKPTDAEIAWCLANRELVMRWLGQRGGWQVYDWAYIEGDGVVCIFDVCDDGLACRLPTGDGRYIFFSDDCDLWLPTCDDVLEMLGQRDLSLWHDGESWRATDADTDEDGAGETRRVALMELLKSCDSTAS